MINNIKQKVTHFQLFYNKTLARFISRNARLHAEAKKTINRFNGQFIV